MLPKKRDREILYFLNENIKNFQQTITKESSDYCADVNNQVTIFISITSDNTHLDWNTHEGYDIEVATTEGNLIVVHISAITVFGARHALETLSQLIEFFPNDDGSNCLVIPKEVKITDSPKYPHRGLLLDTARNFLNTTSIKKHIDAMAISKLNVLHWHITDSQSFPLEIPNLPQMTQ